MRKRDFTLPPDEVRAIVFELLHTSTTLEQMRRRYRVGKDKMTALYVAHTTLQERTSAMLRKSSASHRLRRRTPPPEQKMDLGVLAEIRRQKQLAC